MPRNPSELTAGEKAVAIYSKLLFTGRAWSLTELSEEFRFSKQSVCRIVDQINARGAVKIGREEVDGRLWFRAARPAARPNVTLSPEEIRYLVLCGDLASRLLPEGIPAEVQQTAAKTTVLLSDLRARGSATTSVANPLPLGRVDYSKYRGHLDAICEGIASRRLCRVTYKAPSRAGTKQHLVAPLRLIAHKEALYLRCRVAWPDGEPRPDRTPMHLAVHRIRQIELTERPSRAKESRRSGEDGFGLAHQERLRATIVFRGWAANHVSERIWSDDQILTPGSDHVQLELTSENRHELVTWVLSFAELAEVIAPADLREQVKERLSRGLLVYSGKSDSVPLDRTVPAHSLAGHEDPEARGERTMTVEKVISGGQTGADRAALDLGLELGLPVGGWCPRGRVAEDGEIPLRYGLRQTPSDKYTERTRWNVRDADGTLVFVSGRPGRGTALTLREAKKLGKAHLLVGLGEASAPEEIRAWLRANQIRVLNVAGPRESSRPGTYNEVREVLREALASSMPPQCDGEEGEPT